VEHLTSVKANSRIHVHLLNKINTRSTTTNTSTSEEPSCQDRALTTTHSVIASSKSFPQHWKQNPRLSITCRIRCAIPFVSNQLTRSRNIFTDCQTDNDIGRAVAERHVQAAKDRGCTFIPVLWPAMLTPALRG
jgi:hypothetical protein